MVWRVRRWTVRSSLRSLRVWSRPRHLDVGKVPVGMLFQLNAEATKCMVMAIDGEVMVVMVVIPRCETAGDDRVVMNGDGDDDDNDDADDDWDGQNGWRGPQMTNLGGLW